MIVPPLPDLPKLSVAEKDALIVALWQQVVALTVRVEALEQRVNAPPKTPDSSSLPPSKGQKANRADASRSAGPRQGGLGRKGGGGAMWPLLRLRARKCGER